MKSDIRYCFIDFLTYNAAVRALARNGEIIPNTPPNTPNCRFKLRWADQQTLSGRSLHQAQRHTREQPRTARDSYQRSKEDSSYRDRREVKGHYERYDDRRRDDSREDERYYERDYSRKKRKNDRRRDDSRDDERDYERDYRRKKRKNDTNIVSQPPGK